MTGMDPRVRQGLDDLLGAVAQEIELERQIVELAHQLRREDEDEALMSGAPVILPHLTEYMERAAAILEASE
jgi:hypothetical protein